VSNDKKLRQNFSAFIDRVDLLRLKSEGYYDRVDGFIRQNIKNRIPKNLMKFYKFIRRDELKKLLLHKRSNIDKIKNRQLHNYIIFDRKIVDCDFTLAEYIKRNNFYYPPLSKQLTRIIAGQSIVGGKVRGMVRKIVNKNNLSSIKKGEVLVTPMTSPDFVPYLKKISAIVTDYGGVLCHAAIAAREFNIPCIVGTDNATRAFNNGDIVEVNATKGIVKKI